MDYLERNLDFKPLSKARSFVVFIIFITSCSAQNLSPYLEDLRSVKGELVNHFPETNNGLLGYYSLLPNSNSQILHKGKYINATFELDKIQKFLEQDKIPQFFPNDTCQFVISRISDLIITNNCGCQTLPIPDFLIEIDKFKLLGENVDIEEIELSELKLPKDFEYFVEAKKGVFIEEKFLFEGLNLPDCWVHGYSRGFAISEKRNIAIIWLEIW